MCVHTKKYLYIENKEEILIRIIPLIYNSHMVIAGIHNKLLPLPILCFLEILVIAL